VADGLWLVRGGLPRRTINVFLIEDGDGVTAFDAGIRGMGGALVTTAAPLGGIARVVLSHAHPDHRGGAPAIAAPALCHRDERPDVEGGGGTSYFDYRRARSPLARMRMVALMRLVDAGPVAVAGTLDEGDDVAGFRVVHLPGHAPGLIALWRERDGLVLASDAFGTHSSGAPLLPHPAYSHDPEGARASLLTLAALAPRTAWPAHGDPLTGDVSAALRRVARA
jgi:glyoxylase-like metal-dependent hydrolase (beta-lactamase superfamily II)